MEQLTLFALMQPKDDFPCSNCIFDKCECCHHIEDEDFFCVRGSFQIRPEQLICPQCGKLMEVHQSDMGSDFGICKCGMHRIFNNQGNRLGAFELWRRGQLVGT